MRKGVLTLEDKDRESARTTTEPTGVGKSEEERDRGVEPAGSDSVSGKTGRRHRGLIITIVIILVIACLGVGFAVWHEQPSFCNAICHKPMDPYVQSYGSGNTACLSAVHAKQGMKCLDCHVPTMDQQMAEAGAWLSGDYQDPIPAYTFTYDESYCLNESCHNMTRDELTESTAMLPLNPHATQHGEIACSECHKAHSASVMYCATCHKDAEVPNGWVAGVEADGVQTTDGADD